VRAPVGRSELSGPPAEESGLARTVLDEALHADLRVLGEQGAEVEALDLQAGRERQADRRRWPAWPLAGDRRSRYSARRPEVRTSLGGSQCTSADLLERPKQDCGVDDQSTVGRENRLFTIQGVGGV
jgi:hypothetical protein